jgi:hypothetical protein
VNQYIVFYRELPDGIRMLAVVHGARDYDRALIERLRSLD